MESAVWYAFSGCILDLLELTKEDDADGLVGSWAEASKIYRCWCWPGGEAWIHGMGVFLLVGLQDLVGHLGWRHFLQAGASVNVGWLIGAAWIRELCVVFFASVGALGGSTCR